MNWLDDAAARLDRAVDDFVERHRVPGCIYGVVVDGALERWRAHGVADLETRRSAEDRTLHRIASITKTFTGTAVLQLRDRGRLELEDPIVAHLPELRSMRNRHGPIESITLRRMLMHDSGLVGEPPTMDLAADVTPSLAEILASASLVEVAIPPATAYKYSNLAFALLGEVVQRVSNRPFRRWITEEIAAPLGMNDTIFEPDDARRERVARGYNARTFSDDLELATDRLKFTDGDGGLFSTVADLARWIAFQTSEDDSPVLALGTRREMHNARLLTDESWTEAQGLAWYVTRHADHDYVGHAGLINGFSSRVAFSPTEGFGIVVLVNGVAPVSELALELAHRVRTACPPRSTPRVPPRPVPDRFARLLGLYRARDFGDEARIEWRSNELVLVFAEEREHPRSLEETTSPATFVVHGRREAGETLRVLETSRGEVSGLLLSGYPFDRLAPVEPRLPPSA
jgi:CubicO group peptidase (beta-lactamase class C family)